MKRKLCCFICLMALLLFAGCHTDDTSLRSGTYYAVGDYEEMLTPYLSVDTSEQKFSFGAGSVISFVEYGNYSIEGKKLIAVSQSTTYCFEIEDENTICLTDNGSHAYFKIPVGTRFVFSKELK